MEAELAAVVEMVAAEEEEEEEEEGGEDAVAKERQGEEAVSVQERERERERENAKKRLSRRRRLFDRSKKEKKRGAPPDDNDSTNHPPSLPFAAAIPRASMSERSSQNAPGVEILKDEVETDGTRGQDCDEDDAVAAGDGDDVVAVDKLIRLSFPSIARERASRAAAARREAVMTSKSCA